MRARNPFRLAFDLFLDRVLDYIGSYHLKLDGEVDALVFAGGIGEKGVQFRSIVGKKVECLGYPPVREQHNIEASGQRAAVVDISTVRQEGHGRIKRILVCKTDEQVCGSLREPENNSDTDVTGRNGEGVRARREILE